jgi:antitoxin component YwqK of YwqJK toxin-antitoxin module
MRTVFTLLVIFGVVLTGFGQTKKMFVDSKGKISPDSVKAVAYITEEKIGDSAFVITKYDLKRQPLSRGPYKDSLMAIRNGKFFIYGRYKNQNLETKETTDGLVYLASSGVYLNGVRTGAWLVYDFSGVKMEQFTFENGVLNGPYTRFNVNTGATEEEGNFVNGRREGNFDVYRYKDPKPDYTIVYNKNHPVKTIFHNQKAVAADNLDRYIARTLENYIDTLKAMQIVANLAVSSSGKVDSVISFNKPLPDYISQAVKTAFSTAPVFTPGTQNDLPVKQDYHYNFRYGATLPESRTTNNINSAYASHADLIGRGLNQVGIGKPVN